MADKDELFYKPDIQEPIRERDQAPDKVVEERIYKSQLQEELGIRPEDIPDPLASYESKFEEYRKVALEIKERATFLLDKTIEDLDLYVGDAPVHILELITDLTDISFVDENNNLKPPTDPVYTLPVEVAKCIFRVAGKYEPKGREKDLLASAKSFDSKSFTDTVKKKMESRSYTQSIMYGLQLLLTVLKLSHVIAVHYSVGYLCGFFKGKIKIKIRFKIPKPVNKRITVFNKCVGDWISNEVIAPVERKLLTVVGYSCKTKQKPIKRCDSESWRKIDFTEVNCCEMSPINFGGTSNPDKFIQTSCWKRIVRSELDPNYTAKRTICSYATAKQIDWTSEGSSSRSSGTTGISGPGSWEDEVSEYEAQAANIVGAYIETRPSSSGNMDPQNIPTLSKSIETADAGVVMTDSVLSSIKNNRRYERTGYSEEPWDCFGMEDSDQRTPEERMMAAINDAAGKWLPKSGVPIEGKSYFQFLESIDSVLSTILMYADKIVSAVANLSKWGSSKQLCCFVYLLTAFATIWHSLVKRGTFCPDMAYADAFRNELRWAYNLRNNKDMQELTKLLQVIKNIVDIFINKMKRQIMISGFVLPLGEMWQMIKVVVSNGLSEFLDILFGPLDEVLAGMQTIPEVRHMMNNNCFGFGDFLKFLLCLLGNLKWGIINNIMSVLDFTLPDIVLLQDIMLSRMRLKSLESLSKLLGNVIALILGLKDCYDPNELPSQIVQEELNNEYSNAESLAQLMGLEGLEKLDEYSTPILSDSALFTPDEQDAIDNKQGGIARQFGDFGHAAKEIADNVMSGKDLSVQRFIDPETGEIVSFGSFVTMMEDMSGVTVSEIQESMLHIFDILRGYGDEDV